MAYQWRINERLLIFDVTNDLSRLRLTKEIGRLYFGIDLFSIVDGFVANNFPLHQQDCGNLHS